LVTVQDQCRARTAISAFASLLSICELCNKGNKQQALSNWLRKKAARHLIKKSGVLCVISSLTRHNNVNETDNASQSFETEGVLKNEGGKSGLERR
jgi:hypothetical protein